MLLPEEFHYLMQNTKKWIDNDQTTFSPPLPHLSSDDNLPLLVSDDNNSPPSPPGGNDNNPPPSLFGSNDNLSLPPLPPLVVTTRVIKTSLLQSMRNLQSS